MSHFKPKKMAKYSEKSQEKVQQAMHEMKEETLKLDVRARKLRIQNRQLPLVYQKPERKERKCRKRRNS